MKKVFLAIILALLPLCASAAGIDVAAIRDYTIKALEECPGPKLELKPILNGGPAGFIMYEATLTSADKDCCRHVYVLFSPLTSQLLLPTPFPPAPPHSINPRPPALPPHL